MGVLGSMPTAPFVEQVRAFGEVPTFWEQRIGPCPNALHMGATSRFSPNTSCPVCGGTGTAYRAGTLPAGAKIMSVEFHYSQWVTTVEIQAGDLFAIWLESEFPLAEGDRLALPSRRLDQSEFLVRGTGAGDTLRLTPTLEILGIYTASGVLTSAAYAISGDGKQITFSGPSAPAAGTPYTARYRYRPSYIVAPQSMQKLPQATNGDYFPTLGVLRLFNQSPTDRKTGEA